MNKLDTYIMHSGEEVQTTAVTNENYGLAESEIIISDYVARIAAATGTNGVGEWLHLRKGADPKERTIIRINFDTICSSVIPSVATLSECP